MNLGDGFELTLGFIQTLRQMVREWRAGLFGRGGAPAGNRSLTEFQTQKLGISQGQIFADGEGDILLQEGYDVGLRDGDLISARNRSGVLIEDGDKVVVSYPINGRWAITSKVYKPGKENDPGGLPIGMEAGCSCNGCVPGTKMHLCGDCGCVNRVRLTALPDIPLVQRGFDGWSQYWEELKQIDRVVYDSGCLWVSKLVNGPKCADPDPEHSGEEGEVFDRYRLEVNYSGGWARIVRVEGENCPEISIRWVLCPECEKKCLCPWVFTLAEDGFNNIYPPLNCKLCVTPLPKNRKNEPVSRVCGSQLCSVTLGSLASLTISGTGIAFPNAINEGLLVSHQPVKEFSFDGAYQLDGDHIAGGSCCGIEYQQCHTWGWVEGLTGLPSFHYEGSGLDIFRAGYHVGAELMAFDDDTYKIRAFVMLGFGVEEQEGGSGISPAQCTLAWESASMTCEQLNAAAQSGTLELTTDCRSQAIPWNAQAGTATFTFSGKADPRSISSGHTTSNCGDEPCADATCKIRCVELTTSLGTTYKMWIVDESSTCTDGCGYCNTTCNGSSDEVWGLAADYEDGEIKEKDCDDFPTDHDWVEGVVSYAGGSGGCECGEGATVRMCVSGEGVYSGNLYVCGQGFALSYYYDAGDGLYHLDGGPPGNTEGSKSSNPAGPFYFFFGVNPPCDNFKVTISPGGV